MSNSHLEYIYYNLRGLVTFGRYSVISAKGDKFCNYTFALLPVNSGRGWITSYIWQSMDVRAE